MERGPVERLGGWRVVIASTSAALLASLAVLWWLGPDDPETVSVDDFVSAGDGDPYAVDLSRRVEVGDPVGPITLEGLDDDDLTEADFAGRVVLLNFWASSCAPCVREMPLLESMHQELADEVTFVGIDVAEGLDPARRMIERTGVTYHQTRDPSSAVLRLFGGINLPYTVVLAADGTVAATHSGELDDADEVTELLDRAR